MTYPSKILDYLRWETNIQKFTLQRCEHLYSKLKKDIVSLKLPTESQERLKIVTHSLSTHVDVYKNLGPTTNTFVEVMRKIKETIMGPDTWDDVKNKVIKEMTKSMFNFKEELKIKMLKVQYFKHPDIAGHLYDRHITSYGRIPWKDKVPLYFPKLFYA